jgi:SAM-dependent methyltransferase
MLSVAIQRAISMDLQNMIEFKEGDAETIELPSSTFDAVLCRWGLMFLPDLKAGLSNIHQSLKPDSNFAAAVWSFPNQDSLSATTMSTVMRETNTSPPSPGTPGPFSLSDENSLKSSFVMSGFKDLSIERMNVSFDFDSPDDFTAFITETAGPLQKMLVNQTTERKREILKAITEAAQKYGDKNTGKVSFENEAILLASKK